MRKVGSRHAYLKKMAFAEEAKLNEIPIGSKHAYLEEFAYALEVKLNGIQ